MFHQILKRNACLMLQHDTKLGLNLLNAYYYSSTVVNGRKILFCRRLDSSYTSVYKLLSIAYLDLCAI